MSTVDAVSLKLPIFWSAGPSAWFAQVESQFALRGVTQDDTKYHHVVASLDNSTAQRALSILASPPATEKYQAIKLFLTSAYELPDYERAAALFNMSGLGDYKPSQLMDNMLALLGEHKPCFLFKHLFLQQLPDYVRAPLATSTIADYRQLAQEADKIYASGNTFQQHVQEVNSTDGAARPSPHVNSTRAGSIPQQIIDNMCWYHRRHNQGARKCVVGCKRYSNFYKNQGNLQQGQK